MDRVLDRSDDTPFDCGIVAMALVKTAMLRLDDGKSSGSLLT